MEPNKSLLAELHAMREWSDMISDAMSGMMLLAIAMMVWRQRRVGMIDLPVLILRRELVCMFSILGAVRISDMLVRASAWFEIVASGLRFAMAGVLVVVASHVWKRLRITREGEAKQNVRGI